MGYTLVACGDVWFWIGLSDLGSGGDCRVSGEVTGRRGSDKTGEKVLGCGVRRREVGREDKK
jgi:hypothetical protein